MGLMQLMPDTARALRVTDPWDIEQNVRAGAAYLRGMLDRFQGRVQDALAGYNAGPGAVERHRGVPPYRETQEYVRRVLGLYQGPAMVAANKVLLRRDAQNRFVLTYQPPAAQR
jgi:soluble lytic murein transglycosylase-like protein